MPAPRPCWATPNRPGTEVDKAGSAFERAIQGDPADPLPRLGMGLAKIRDGDLERGTREIETAASPDLTTASSRRTGRRSPLDIAILNFSRGIHDDLGRLYRYEGERR
ncbi:MAG: tetratricopeptide repeat protein [bacterium]